MSDCQNTADRNSQQGDETESEDSQVPSGSYYYDDRTGYEPYETEDDDDDDESIEKDG
jgi:hypothetical protein